MPASRPLWQSATIAFLLYLLASIIPLDHGTFAHFGSTSIGYGPNPPEDAGDARRDLGSSMQLQETPG